MKLLFIRIFILFFLISISSFSQKNDLKIKQEIITKIQDSCKAGKFSGGAVVWSNGKFVFHEYCGYANRELKTEIISTTPFKIASMGKMFTIISILQLLEQGKINLDSSLITYLPSYPNQNLAKSVTLKHLLTHTGGTGDIFGPEAWEKRKELKTLEDYVKLFGNRETEFKPGSKSSYSNYGFILLGRVIEEVSKLSYYEYVQKNIFNKAGMKNSSFPIGDSLPSYHAISYTIQDSGKLFPDEGPYRGTSAGGGSSTVEDLTLFGESLLNKKLISSTSLDKIINGELLIDGKKYPYGFIKRTDKNGNIWFGHNGGAPGTNGNFVIYPKQKIIKATLSNLDPPSAMDIYKIIDGL